mmetsp:Transcript_128166/g.371079  ORF Transcript_128166/g.371079 Transcript_128166/m.371079 type:complete len:326 (-) Transcript_128166:137-1114(-)
MGGILRGRRGQGGQLLPQTLELLAQRPRRVGGIIPLASRHDDVHVSPHCRRLLGSALQRCGSLLARRPGGCGDVAGQALYEQLDARVRIALLGLEHLRRGDPPCDLLIKALELLRHGRQLRMECVPSVVTEFVPFGLLVHVMRPCFGSLARVPLPMRYDIGHREHRIPHGIRRRRACCRSGRGCGTLASGQGHVGGRGGADEGRGSTPQRSLPRRDVARLLGQRQRRLRAQRWARRVLVELRPNQALPDAHRVVTQLDERLLQEAVGLRPHWKLPRILWRRWVQWRQGPLRVPRMLRQTISRRLERRNSQVLRGALHAAARREER